MAKGKGSSSNNNNASKKDDDSKDLKTCNHVKGRHILTEKQSKIQEVLTKIQEWQEANNGKNITPAEFGKLAQAYSECSSAKKGGDLGWFPRGKMVGQFQEVAFSTPVGETSAIFKTVNGYHIFICEGRKM